MNACESLYVAAGFREDCLNLIAQFEIIENDTFIKFCEIWNSMNFSYVFAGRASHPELIEFAEEALDIAKEFISPNKSLKIKIGGIYLLYSLFFTMPVSQPKIRMVFTEWQNVVQLRNQLYKNKKYQPVYILKQLIEKNAFTYCATEHERGLENYYLLKDFMRGNSRITQSLTKENEWMTIFDDLNNKNKLYLNEKEKLSKFSHHLVPKIFDSTEVDKLMDTVKKLNNLDSNSISNSTNINIRTGGLGNNENLIISNLPSTSTDEPSYKSHLKLDSGDESDTSDETDDDEQYL